MLDQVLVDNENTVDKHEDKIEYFDVEIFIDRDLDYIYKEKNYEEAFKKIDCPLLDLDYQKLKDTSLNDHVEKYYKIFRQVILLN